MEQKRFIGNDLNRLLARIRREIGPDAMVIRTRSLLREGAEPLVEVLAGLPDPGDDLPPGLQRTMVNSVLARLDPSVTVGEIEDMLARSGGIPGEHVPVRPAPAPATSPSAWAAPNPHLHDEAALDDLMNQRPAPPPPVTARFDEAPASLAPLRASSHGQVPGDLRAVLRSAGFSALSVEAIHEIAPQERDSVRAIGAALQRGVLTYPEEDQTAILTVQGTGGSGRTTALLRMALDCVNSGRPAVVAALSADAHQSAAVRAFSRAAGIRFETARDWKTIGRLSRDAEPGTCLFIDVPAGPFRMPLPVGVRHFRYLAVPAATGAGSLNDLLGGFDLRPFNGAVLTFGDRATTLLPAVDFLVRTGLGAAFVSDGADPGTGIAIADPIMLASGSLPTATRDVTDGRLPATA